MIYRKQKTTSLNPLEGAHYKLFHTSSAHGIQYARVCSKNEESTYASLNYILYNIPILHFYIQIYIFSYSRKY